MTPPPATPPLSPEEQYTAALDRFIRERVDPTEQPLVAALIQFLPTVACTVYLRDAATAWLKGKTPTQPET